MRFCQKSPFLCCELECTSLSFVFEIFCPSKFPRPALNLFDFPVSKKMRLIYTGERLAVPPPVCVLRFERNQDGCRNAVLHAVIYGISYSVLRWPSSEIKNKKKGEESHLVTLSEFVSLCCELGVGLRCLRFRWVANFGRKSQVVIFLSRAWPQV